MRLAPRAQAKRQDLVVAPRQIHPRVDLDQQIHEDRHECRARQDVAADDVEGEVGQEDERQALGDGEAVRDLGVHLGVRVVGEVDAGEGREAVEGDVDEEEERVVDEEGDQEFED